MEKRKEDYHVTDIDNAYLLHKHTLLEICLFRYALLAWGETLKEMALKVKDSLLQREKRILVAIDVAERKMENLSMINTLCHHFSAARTTNRNCWLEKLSSVLGKESVDGLEELVSCQKKYNKLMGYSVELKGAHSDLKQVIVTLAHQKYGLIKKLKGNPEKRKFLKSVMTKAKVLLKSNISIHTSVVGLLNSALKSKYRPHVLRCFKDMDVESLMNILFLMMPSSTSLSDEHSVANDYLYDETVMPQQLESHYYTESPVSLGSLSQSVFWDDEETIINLIDELKDEPSTDHQKKLEETDIVIWKNQGKSNINDCPNFQLEEDFRNAIFPFLNPSYIEEIFSEDSEQKDHFLELKVLETYEKFDTSVLAPYMEAINGLLTDYTNYDNENMANMTDETSNDISNLIQIFHQFRSLVLLLFTRNRTKFDGVEVQSFNRMTIDLQLLSIGEDKLTKRFNHAMAIHGDLQERLNRTLMETQQEVHEAKCQLDQELRNSIKEHVAAETSLGKSREIEIFKLKGDLDTINESLSQTTKLVGQTVKSLRARRHYLEASLESLKRHYDSTMLKYQVKIDDLSVEEAANNKVLEKLQNKFKHVEETYDEMRAMKRLKQLLQNMEKAEAIKQNWAARKIQVAWRKYKVAKLRKKKLKGRKKGKKKTPPPGKGGSPATKSSTPGSRSKSQTP